MARRNPADGAALDPALTQKKRARRRLVGAVALGVAAAIVLPLVLDSEPRQTISDVEIEIPPREAALPEVDSPKHDVAVASSATDEAVVPPSPTEPVAQGQSEPKDLVRPEAGSQAGGAAESGAQPQPAVKATAQPDAKTATQAEAKADPGSEAPASVRRSSKTEAPKVAAAQPRAESTAAASGTRFALQVGAFANAGSARAQLDKARRTGLRAYTETVQTAQGERTRVRVGPFPTREEAEKARATLKLVGMDSAVVDAR